MNNENRFKGKQGCPTDIPKDLLSPNKENYAASQTGNNQSITHQEGY
jgi:hypothetical protein